MSRTPAPGVERLLGPDSDANGLRVVVAGLGVSGSAAVEGLLAVGATVVGIDAAATPPPRLAESSGAALTLRLGVGSDDSAILDGTDLVIASPGWRPTHPLLGAARAASIPIWSEAELAWRLRDPHGPPWICVTGTNGKTTTVGLLAAILDAAGLGAREVGNIGPPIMDAVRDPGPARMFAVELSSFQLHHTYSTEPLAAACLNVAADHLDWHGGYDAYRAAKARVYARTRQACVYTVADPQTAEMVAAADVRPGCRAVGVSLGVPGPGMIGIVEGIVVDRAFVPDPQATAVELATLGDLADVAGQAGPTPHIVSNALVAAALARAAGVAPAAVRDGLRAGRLSGHRGQVVGVIGGVAFVDDSKATNPHAAAAALSGAGDHVVWVAGGQAKGARFDEVIAAHARRLRAVILVGVDRDVVSAARDRHAPQVHQVRVDPSDTGDVDDFLDRVVAAAVRLARPGDTVLLAPGGASLDQFTSYAARGDAFTRAVHRISVVA